MATEAVKTKDTRLYDVLGVPPTATQHEISVAYRRKREQVRVPTPAAALTHPLPSHNCSPPVRQTVWDRRLGSTPPSDGPPMPQISCKGPAHSLHPPPSR